MAAMADFDGSLSQIDERDLELQTDDKFRAGARSSMIAIRQNFLCHGRCRSQRVEIGVGALVGVDRRGEHPVDGAASDLRLDPERATPRIVGNVFRSPDTLPVRFTA